jgi:hypothetical protein
MILRLTADHSGDSVSAGSGRSEAGIFWNF